MPPKKRKVVKRQTTNNTAKKAKSSETPSINNAKKNKVVKTVILQEGTTMNTRSGKFDSSEVHSNNSGKKRKIGEPSTLPEVTTVKNEVEKLNSNEIQGNNIGKKRKISKTAAPVEQANAINVNIEKPDSSIGHRNDNAKRRKVGRPATALENTPTNNTESKILNSDEHISNSNTKNKRKPRKSSTPKKATIVITSGIEKREFCDVHNNDKTKEPDKPSALAEMKTTPHHTVKAEVENPKSEEDNSCGIAKKMKKAGKTSKLREVAATMNTEIEKPGSDIIHSIDNVKEMELNKNLILSPVSDIIKSEVEKPKSGKTRSSANANKKRKVGKIQEVAIAVNSDVQNPESNNAHSNDKVEKKADNKSSAHTEMNVPLSTKIKKQKTTNINNKAGKTKSHKPAVFPEVAATISDKPSGVTDNTIQEKVDKIPPKISDSSLSCTVNADIEKVKCSGVHNDNSTANVKICKTSAFEGTNTKDRKPEASEIHYNDNAKRETVEKSIVIVKSATTVNTRLDTSETISSKVHSYNDAKKITSDASTFLEMANTAKMEIKNPESIEVQNNLIAEKRKTSNTLVCSEGNITVNTEIEKSDSNVRFDDNAKKKKVDVFSILPEMPAAINTRTEEPLFIESMKVKKTEVDKNSPFLKITNTENKHQESVKNTCDSEIPTLPKTGDVVSNVVEKSDCITVCKNVCTEKKNTSETSAFSEMITTNIENKKQKCSDIHNSQLKKVDIISKQLKTSVSIDTGSKNNQVDKDNIVKRKKRGKTLSKATLTSKTVAVKPKSSEIYSDDDKKRKAVVTSTICETNTSTDEKSESRELCSSSSEVNLNDSSQMKKVDIITTHEKMTPSIDTESKNKEVFKDNNAAKRKEVVKPLSSKVTTTTKTVATKPESRKIFNDNVNKQKIVETSALCGTDSTANEKLNSSEVCSDNSQAMKVDIISTHVTMATSIDTESKNNEILKDDIAKGKEVVTPFLSESTTKTVAIKPVTREICSDDTKKKNIGKTSTIYETTKIAIEKSKTSEVGSDSSEVHCSDNLQAKKFDIISTNVKMVTSIVTGPKNNEVHKDDIAKRKEISKTLSEATTTPKTVSVEPKSSEICSDNAKKKKIIITSTLCEINATADEKSKSTEVCSDFSEFNSSDNVQVKKVDIVSTNGKIASSVDTEYKNNKAPKDDNAKRKKVVKPLSSKVTTATKTVAMKTVSREISSDNTEKKKVDKPSTIYETTAITIEKTKSSEVFCKDNVEKNKTDKTSDVTSIRSNKVERSKSSEGNICDNTGNSRVCKASALPETSATIDTKIEKSKSNNAYNDHNVTGKDKTSKFLDTKSKITAEAEKPSINEVCIDNNPKKKKVDKNARGTITTVSSRAGNMIVSEVVNSDSNSKKEVSKTSVAVEVSTIADSKIKKLESSNVHNIKSTKKKEVDKTAILLETAVATKNSEIEEKMSSEFDNNHSAKMAKYGKTTLQEETVTTSTEERESSESSETLYKLKNTKAFDVAMSVSDALRSETPSLSAFDDSGLVFIMNDLKACPTTSTLCGKLEVVSGVNPSTHKLTMLCKSGSKEIDITQIRSDSIKFFYKKMLDFIESSLYKIYNPQSNSGFWKCFSIVADDVGKVLIIVTGYRGKMKSYDISELCTEIKHYFLEEYDDKHLNSLIFQICSISKTNSYLLIGDGQLNYCIGDLKVKVFQDSQFFSNPYGVQLLSNSILDFADVDKTWGILQIGSQFDLVSMRMAQECRRMIVIDQSDNYVKHLLTNLKDNNISTVHPAVGSVNSMLQNAINSELQSCENICVLFFGQFQDITVDVSSCLLLDERVKKIILVSEQFEPCELQKICSLCKSEQGDPFIFVTGIPVDLCPYNTDIRIIYLLLRVSVLRSNLVLSSEKEETLTEIISPAKIENIDENSSLSMISETLSPNLMQSDERNETVMEKVNPEKIENVNESSNLSLISETSVLSPNSVQFDKTNETVMEKINPVKIENVDESSNFSLISETSVLSPNLVQSDEKNETVMERINPVKIENVDESSTFSLISEISTDFNSSDCVNMKFEKEDSEVTGPESEVTGHEVKESESDKNKQEKNEDTIIELSSDSEESCDGSANKSNKPEAVLRGRSNSLKWIEKWALVQKAALISHIVNSTQPNITDDKNLLIPVKPVSSSTLVPIIPKTFHLIDMDDPNREMISMNCFGSSDHRSDSPPCSRNKLIKKIYDRLTDFLQCNNTIDYEFLLKQGFGKSVTICLNDRGRALLDLHISELGEEKDKKLRLSFLSKLKDYFLRGNGKDCNVVSLTTTTYSQDKVWRNIIYGEGHFVELIGNLKFEITGAYLSSWNLLEMKTFSQALLYLSDINKMSGVLQIGYMSAVPTLYIANVCKKMVVLDLNKNVGKNIFENAVINNIKNVLHLLWPLKDMTYEFFEHNFKSCNSVCVVIYNLNETVLDADVVEVLQCLHKVKNVICVSSVKNLQHLKKLLLLCKELDNHSDDFIITKAMSIENKHVKNDVQVLYLLERESDVRNRCNYVSSFKAVPVMLSKVTEHVLENDVMDDKAIGHDTSNVVMEKEYKQQVLLKDVCALSQAKYFSYMLSPVAPVIIKERSPELIFNMENFRQCSLEKSSSHIFEVVSGINSSNRNAEMKFSFYSRHMSIPMRPFDSPIVERVYKNLMNIISKSKLEIFNPETKRGFWKSILIRVNNESQMFTLIEGNGTRHFEDKPFQRAIYELTSYFESTVIGSFKMSPILLKVTDGSEELIRKILFWTSPIVDTINNYNVKICEDLFLWTHEPSSLQMLSDMIVEMAKLNERWTILQIGYHDGISIMNLAQVCGHIYIIDNRMLCPNQHYILQNAEYNGLPNITVLGRVKNELSFEAALINAGLHTYLNICVIMHSSSITANWMSSVLNNKFLNIRKVVCVSDAWNTQKIKTVLTLCKENEGKNFFVVTKAAAVDLSPVKSTVKMLYLLEHVSQLKGKVEENTKSTSVGKATKVTESKQVNKSSTVTKEATSSTVCEKTEKQPTDGSKSKKKSSDHNDDDKKTGKSSEKENITKSFEAMLDIKKKKAVDSAKHVSDSLKLHIPSLTTFPDTGLVFIPGDLAPCPWTTTRCDMLRAISGIDPITKKVNMLCASKGAVIQKEHIRLDVIRLLYCKLLDYMRHSSYALYNPKNSTGFWHSISILVNELEEVMVVVEGRISKHLKKVEDELSALSYKMRKYFQDKDPVNMRITSLIFKTRFRDAKHAVYVLIGKEYLNYHLGSLDIQVFQDSKFFSNPFGVELLSDTVLELAAINETWSILQLGPEFDFVSLNLAEKCKKMVVCKKNEDSAKHFLINAKKNKIKIFNHVAADMTKALQTVLVTDLRSSEDICVVICGKLHDITDDMCSNLIREERVKRVLLVCKELDSAELKKVIRLCKSVIGDPFALVMSVPVDTCPYSDSITTIYLLVRNSFVTPSSEEVTTSPVDKAAATPVNQPAATPVDQPATSPVNKPVVCPVNKPDASCVDMLAVTSVDKPAVTPVDKPAVTPVDQPAATPVDKLAATPVDKPAASPVHSDMEIDEDEEDNDKSAVVETTPGCDITYDSDMEDIEEHRIGNNILQLDRELYKTISNAVYQRGEKSAVEIQQIAYWKQLLVLHYSKYLSDYFAPLFPFLVTTPSEGLVFYQDPLVTCPPEEESRHIKFHAFTGVDPKTDRVMMVYDILLDGSLVPVTFHHSPIFKKIYEKVMKFINASGYELYNPKTKTGVWKSITIRQNESGQFLLAIVACFTKGGMLGFTMQVQGLCSALIDHLRAVNSHVVSAVMQVKILSENATFYVTGNGFLNYKFPDMKVTVHALTSPWPNPYAVKVISNAITTLALLDQSWSVIQVGCGYGIESLYLAPLCWKVFVFANFPKQGEGLLKTAQENGITNIEVFPISVMKKEFDGFMKRNLNPCKNVCLVINRSNRGYLVISSTARLVSLGSKLVFMFSGAVLKYFGGWFNVPLKNLHEIKQIIWVTNIGAQEVQKTLQGLCMENKESQDPFVMARVMPIDISSYENDTIILYHFIRLRSLVPGHVQPNPLYFGAQNNNLGVPFASNTNQNQHFTQASSVPILQGSSMPVLQGSCVPSLLGSSVCTLQGSHVSTLQASSVSTLQRSSVSSLQESHVPALQRYPLPTLQGSSVPTLQTVSTLQGSPVAALQATSVSSLQGSPVPTLQTSSVPAFQGSSMSALQGSPVSALLGSPMSDLQGSPASALQGILNLFIIAQSQLSCNLTARSSSGNKKTTDLKSDHNSVPALADDTKRHTVYSERHSKDTNKSTKDSERDSRVSERCSRDNEKYSSDTERHARDTERHSRHVRDIESHSKDTERHSRQVRDTERHSRHARDTEIHSRDTERHSRDTERYTRHARNSERHSRHVKDTESHSSDTERHSRDTERYTRHARDNERQDRHVKDTESHSRDTERHSRETERQSRHARDTYKPSRDTERFTRDSENHGGHAETQKQEYNLTYDPQTKQYKIISKEDMNFKRSHETNLKGNSNAHTTYSERQTKLHKHEINNTYEESSNDSYAYSYDSSEHHPENASAAADAFTEGNKIFMQKETQLNKSTRDPRLKTNTLLSSAHDQKIPFREASMTNDAYSYDSSEHHPENASAAADQFTRGNKIFMQKETQLNKSTRDPRLKTNILLPSAHDQKIPFRDASMTNDPSTCSSDALTNFSFRIKKPYQRIGENASGRDASVISRDTLVSSKEDRRQSRNDFTLFKQDDNTLKHERFFNPHDVTQQAKKPPSLFEVEVNPTEIFSERFSSPHEVRQRAKDPSSSFEAKHNPPELLHQRFPTPHSAMQKANNPSSFPRVEDNPAKNFHQRLLAQRKKEYIDKNSSAQSFCQTLITQKKQESVEVADSPAKTFCQKLLAQTKKECIDVKNSSMKNFQQTLITQRKQESGEVADSPAKMFCQKLLAQKKRSL